MKKTGGVQLYGGYDCENGWQRIADHAIVAPASGLALAIENAAETVVIERIAFRASRATTPGESSIAASIVAAPSV